MTYAESNNMVAGFVMSDNCIPDTWPVYNPRRIAITRSKLILLFIREIKNLYDVNLPSWQWYRNCLLYQ